MDQPLRIEIIGDLDPNHPSHIATNEALNHAAKAFSVPSDVVWLPTQPLEDGFRKMKLQSFDALWCAPGSPYKSMGGALRTREQGWPFIGT